MIAHDEALELMNKVFSMFPKAKTLESFIRQGTFVGITERCKRFVQMFYRVCSEYGEREVYVHATDPSMTPELKLIFELFVLLDTCTENEERAMTPDLVSSKKDDVTTILKRDKMEAATKNTSDMERSYNRIFSSIEQILPNQRQSGAADESDDESGGGEDEDIEMIDEDELMGDRDDIDLVGEADDNTDSESAEGAADGETREATAIESEEGTVGEDRSEDEDVGGEDVSE
ncbi:hypothetical protein THAOC_33191, partial [Thalassiosira oceanica]